MTSPAAGIVEVRGRDSVERTVERLKGLLQEKGLTLFALVDHDGEAKRVGMTMPPTKLLVFGSPRVGTPVMLAAPSIAIDLPLKILVRADAAGTVWVAYNSTAHLQQRHGVPPEWMANLSAVEALAATAAG